MAITQVNLPAVYGAVQQHKTGQMQNQLLQMQMDSAKAAQQKQGALSSLFAEQYGGTDPTSGITWDTGRQGPGAMTDKQFAGRVMALDPQAGMALQDHVAKMTLAQREQWKFEAPLVARAMGNVKDQPSYAAALNALGNAGVDLSDLPEEYSPENVSSMMAIGQEAESFTLSPGQTRFGPGGQPLASMPAAPQQPTSGMQEYQEAVRQGFKGTFLDYKTAVAQAGRPQTNVTVGGGKYGTIPPGYMLKDGPDGEYMVPIPGGPAAQEIEAETRAAEERTVAQTQTSAGKAETMLDATGSVKKIMKEAKTPATGTNSRPFALHSGTAAGQVRSYVGTLKSGVALGAMLRLKEASATGATGFGALSEKELALLIDDIGALDPDTTEPEIFLKTIDRIERRYNGVVEDIRKNVSPERIRELGLESLLGSGGNGQATDFSAMSPEELSAVDATKLSDTELDALVEALTKAAQ
jgi:hypothetical protein